jgi:hypothetical protein
MKKSLFIMISIWALSLLNAAADVLFRLAHHCSAPLCAWAKFAFKDFMLGVRR